MIIQNRIFRKIYVVCDVIILQTLSYLIFEMYMYIEQDTFNIKDISFHHF